MLTDNISPASDDVVCALQRYACSALCICMHHDGGVLQSQCCSADSKCLAYERRYFLSIAMLCLHHHIVLVTLLDTATKPDTAIGDMCCLFIGYIAVNG